METPSTRPSTPTTDKPPVPAVHRASADVSYGLPPSPRAEPVSEAKEADPHQHQATDASASADASLADQQPAPQQQQTAALKSAVRAITAAVKVELTKPQGASTDEVKPLIISCAMNG